MSRVVDKLLELAREKKNEGERDISRSPDFSRVGVGDDQRLAALAAPVEVDDDEAFPAFDSELYERLILEEKYFDGAKNGKSGEAERKNPKRRQFIKDRVTSLLAAIVKFGSLDPSHFRELKFLIENFYSVSEHAFSLDESLCGITGKRELSSRACEVAVDLAYKLRGLSFDEACWEVEKLFDYDGRLSFFDDVCGFEDDVKAVSHLLQRGTALELDVLLAQVGTKNITNVLGARSAEYLERFGREYDEERITKDGIRLLIKCGAKLNRYLLSERRENAECDIRQRIFTLKEHIPDRIIVKREEDGVRVLRYAENTKENRLFNLYCALRDLIKLELSLDGFCAAFDNNEALPDGWLSCGKKLARATALWDKAKRNERRIASIASELDDLKARYARGERTVVLSQENADSEDALIKRGKELSYPQFISYRDDDLTHALLLGLNDMSLAEIRQRFFGGRNMFVVVK